MKLSCIFLFLTASFTAAAVADENIPQGVLPWQWQRFKRCARVVPHQAPQLAALSPANTDLAQVLAKYLLLSIRPPQTMSVETSDMTSFYHIYACFRMIS